MSTGMQAVSDDDFVAKVLESEPPVVVDFWAAWCPPCRVMEPILDELAREHPDVRFVKLDAHSNQRTVVNYGVLSMPTLMVFRDGAETVGAVPADQPAGGRARADAARAQPQGRRADARRA